jgi:eukaryotic-like serine/threonine-protein kinase
MLAEGNRLGPYEIRARLRAGGRGEVYRARDTRLGRDVAVKVLLEKLSPTPRLRQRFEREARAISQLSHPHICTLYDFGREGETEYLVMELLEGGEPRALFQTRILPQVEVRNQFDARRDGDLFVVDSQRKEDAAAPITVPVGWSPAANR